MKHFCFFWCCLLGSWAWSTAQDTFSIVAIDTVTGEIGSAGASCLDANVTPGGVFIISDIVAGRGAIHTQSFYLPGNQQNARARLLAGDSPQQLLAWLQANDVQGDASQRQYGIVAFEPQGGVEAAAFTGANCLDYKGQRVGANYAIQGNILLGPQILDSMEAAFLTTPGSLADRLMAAMQGANVPGADSRCLAEGVSSQSAFLRVARPSDPDGAAFLDLLVDQTPFGVEPIEVLAQAYAAWEPPACDFSVPATAQVVNRDTVLSGLIQEAVWVCAGVQLSLTNSSLNQVYLDSGAVVSLSGGFQNEVFISPGAEANGGNAFSSTYIYAPGSRFGDLGPNPQFVACDSLQLDFSQLATCTVTSLAHPLETPWTLRWLTSDRLALTRPPGPAWALQLLDLQGRVLGRYPWAGDQLEVSVEDLPRGWYVLEVKGEGAPVSKRFWRR